MNTPEPPEPRCPDYASQEEFKLAWHFWRAQRRESLLTAAESRAKCQALGEHLGLHPDQIANILGDWGK